MNILQFSYRFYAILRVLHPNEFGCTAVKLVFQLLSERDPSGFSGYAHILYIVIDASRWLFFVLLQGFFQYADSFLQQGVSLCQFLHPHIERR